MKTYTLFTTPEEVIQRNLPHKYSMELVGDDMLTVLAGLAAIGESDSEWSENATSLRVGILETLGIEEV